MKFNLSLKCVRPIKQSMMGVIFEIYCNSHEVISERHRVSNPPSMLTSLHVKLVNTEFHIDFNSLARIVADFDGEQYC